jgi:hypothetical protein
MEAIKERIRNKNNIQYKKLPTNAKNKNSKHLEIIVKKPCEPSKKKE